MAEITFALNKLLAKKKVLQISPVLQVTPANDETKKQLKEFRENCIAIHKHRDTNISATVIYKMMRHGKHVDDLVVFKEGTAVPKKWLSKGDSGLLYLFFALGTPLAGKSISIDGLVIFISFSCCISILENEHPERENQETDCNELYWCLIMFKKMLIL